MMKNLALLLIILINLKQASAQEFGTLKDARDGKVYKTVQIGEQVWMAENLIVSKFRNGDPIREVITDNDWRKAIENQQPAWCYYENKKENGVTHGKLYNWFAVNDPRGLAPSGWYIPSHSEWIKLCQTLDENTIANEVPPNINQTKSGLYLKSGFGWVLKGRGYNGTNTSGFSAFPGGKRSQFGPFLNINQVAVWWCSAISSTVMPSVFMLYGVDYYGAHLSSEPASSGLSVRCLKDQASFQENLHDKSNCYWNCLCKYSFKGLLQKNDTLFYRTNGQWTFDNYQTAQWTFKYFIKDNPLLSAKGAIAINTYKEIITDENYFYIGIYEGNSTFDPELFYQNWRDSSWNQGNLRERFADFADVLRIPKKGGVVQKMVNYKESIKYNGKYPPREQGIKYIIDGGIGKNNEILWKIFETKQIWEPIFRIKFVSR